MGKSGTILNRCTGLLHRNTTGPKGKVQFCKAALSMTSLDVANSIRHKIDRISIQFKKLYRISPRIRHLYIASPTNANTTVEMIKRYLKKSKVNHYNMCENASISRLKHRQGGTLRRAFSCHDVRV